MKKKFTNLLITLLISLFAGIPNIFAEVKVISRKNIIIDDKVVFKIYDDLETGEKDLITSTGGIIKISIDGVEHIGYCIDFGVHISTGTTADKMNLYNYYKNVLTEEQTEALINKLTLYTKFGYGSDGKESVEYYLATQQLIWEEINKTGFYQSEFYKERAGSKYNPTNIRWTTDKGATTIDLSQEINSINNSINQYYKTPSFCSNQNKLEIEIGKSAQYTDTNNVLSSYKVICDTGIACTTNGNTLNVEAVDEAGSKKITFYKASKGEEKILYRYDDEQGIIVDKGILEAITCEFGVDTFKNVQTSDTTIIYILIAGLCSIVVSYCIYCSKKIFN